MLTSILKLLAAERASDRRPLRLQTIKIKWIAVTVLQHIAPLLQRIPPLEQKRLPTRRARTPPPKGCWAG